MDSRTKIIIGLSIIAAVLLFGLGWCSKPDTVITSSETTRTTTRTTTVLIPLLKFVDSTVVRVTVKKIRKEFIDSSLAHYIPDPDSVDFPLEISDSSGLYLTPAFEFGYHNISATTKDTHEVKYYFPENKIVFTEFPAPREKVTEYKEIFKEVIKEKPKTFWESDGFVWSSRFVALGLGVWAGYELGKGAK